LSSISSVYVPAGNPWSSFRSAPSGSRISIVQSSSTCAVRTGKTAAFDGAAPVETGVAPTSATVAATSIAAARNLPLITPLRKRIPLISYAKEGNPVFGGRNVRPGA
jgi:hypothetical protein